MNKRWGVTATILIMCMVGMVATPVLAVPVEPHGVILPHGEKLSDGQLAEIEGEGLLSVAIGSGVGALVGYTSYVLDYSWDRYVNQEDRSWSWSDAAKESLKGAIAGGIAAALLPAP